MAVVTVAFENLDTWLQNQSANTVDTPYELNITGLTIENLLSSSDTGTLGNVLKNNNSKYVDLSNTSLPSNITYLNGLNSTFLGCKSLVYAPVIPNTVNSLRNTFYKCSSLKTAPNIPIGVYIMDGTFYECTSLTITPSIPNTVWDMSQTFGSCTALIKVVNIPTSAKDISGVVANCVSLQEISLFEADLETILSEPSSLYKSSSAFYNCPLLTKIGVAETTTVTPEESTDWHCFRLKFGSTTVQGKVYDKTGTAVTISQTTVTKGTLKLPIKTDELWFPIGYTDAQIDAIIEKAIQYRYAYMNDANALDPSNKNFVLWADNPSNVKTNMFNSLNVATIGGLGKYIIAIEEVNGKINGAVGDIDTAVTSGSNNPVTSGGVANALNIPTDAVLHYSFDEVPDLPDGSAFYRRNNNFTSSDLSLWSGGSNVATIENGKLVISSVATGYFRYSLGNSTINNPIIKIKFKFSKDDSISLYGYVDAVSTVFKTISVKANEEAEITVNVMGSVGSVMGLTNMDVGGRLEILQFYIGDGSYTTPIIDNANGQNNATNNGGIAVQGVSGKGAYFLNGKYAQVNDFNFADNFSVSVWVRPENNTNGLQGIILQKGSVFGFSNGLATDNSLILTLVGENQTLLNKEIIATLLTSNVWTNVILTKNDYTFKAYINGVIVKTKTLLENKVAKNSNNCFVSSSTNDRPQSIDDLLIFDRALTENEVIALYLNKANTPKYYSWADWKLNQMETAQTRTVETKGGEEETEEEKPIEEEPKEEER